VAWAAASGGAQDLARRVEVSVRRKRRRRQLVAAACAAGLIALGSLWVAPRKSSPAAVAPAPAAFASLPEDRRLPDGSLVELRPGARLTVDFSDAVRRVVLESGEAHFSVAKNPARPFVVVAGGVEVRAVGTAFAVEMSRGQVEVLVTEGRVALDRSASGDASKVSTDRVSVHTLATLGAGDRVRVDAGSTAATIAASVVEQLSAAEVARRLAWRVPQLTLSATPLSEVIPVFNRYSSEQLVLDPALDGLRLGGVLRADNTPALLQLLKNEFGVEAERRDGAIWLRRR
jgi:transmembrane sensor